MLAIATTMEKSNNEEQCSNRTIAVNGESQEGDFVGGKISVACFTLNTFGSKKAKKILSADFQPNEFTVILGRGASSDCAGNRRLKLLVQSYLQQYLDAPDKLGKSLIVSRVVEVVREASPRAAFVKYEKGRWVDVGERTSREKVGSMFRDCLGDKYKSSAKTKTAIRAQKKKEKQQQQQQQQQQRAQDDNQKRPAL